MGEVRPQTREYLDGLFTPGARIGGDPQGWYSWIEIAEVQDVATVRLPSGRLVVDSPWIAGPPRELASRIPPGEYPVDVAWASCPRFYDGSYEEYRECAAMRLRVRDEPVAVWELALGVGEEPALRADGAGFEAEEAMGCFVDATAWQPLTEPFRRFLAGEAADGFGGSGGAGGFGGSGGSSEGRGTERLCGGWFELARDEERRADLLTFGVPEGWGQVWTGLARDGEVAVIVVPGPVPTSPWD
ncbi:DUF4241 domain-containing protein [Kitasatospora sp. NPDC093806]|uniref:DUF4241 domain-containing protein n=1 Tax=Kitasatospora sp. NPDC093806 TaxID=3155075 RepID=UPI003436B09A